MGEKREVIPLDFGEVFKGTGISMEVVSEEKVDPELEKLVNNGTIVENEVKTEEK